MKQVQKKLFTKTTAPKKIIAFTKCPSPPSKKIMVRPLATTYTHVRIVVPILNYPKDMCYKKSLQKTNLLPLEFRRDISGLILLFKGKYNLITIDITKLLYTFNP